MKPLENHMVIGDYYPRREKAEPDPDAWLERVAAEVDREFAEFPEWKKRGAENYLGFADDASTPREQLVLFGPSAKCPHNCKGCTCRTDPRQLSFDFTPQADTKI